MSVIKEMDTVYPDHLPCLKKNILEQHPQKYKRAVKKNMNRHSGRYRTTPVTFDEIKEVDEEGLEDTANDQPLTTSELNLKAQLDNFKDFQIKNSRDLGSEMEKMKSDLVPNRTFTTVHANARQDSQSSSRSYKAKSRPSI